MLCRHFGSSNYNDVDGAREGRGIKVPVILVRYTDCIDRTTKIVHSRNLQCREGYLDEIEVDFASGGGRDVDRYFGQAMRPMKRDTCDFETHMNALGCRRRRGNHLLLPSSRASQCASLESRITRPASSTMAPAAISPFTKVHTSYVKSLYRRMLNNELNWVIRRDLWRPRALAIRAEFERNRYVMFSPYHIH